MNNQPPPPLYVRPLLFLSLNGKYLKTFEWIMIFILFILLFIIIGFGYEFWGIYIGLALVIELWILLAKKWIIHNI